MERIVQLPRVRNADDKPESTLAERPDSAFTLDVRTDASAEAARGRGALAARARGDAKELEAEALRRDDDQVQVVRFEPLQNQNGPLLLVAHVFSARLSDLCGAAEAAHRSKARLPTLVDRREASVQLEVRDALQGQAVVRVERGVLGPMSIELRLEQGRLGLVALVSTPRAAEALHADRELLRASLARQGIELGSFSVVVERKRSGKKARVHARADDGKRKGE